ncbi:MAG: hypothetical protein ACLR0M_03860 [[Clostridium] symbiosum]
MKVDRRFHCFGCQADGDVIDFASRFHGKCQPQGSRPHCWRRTSLFPMRTGERHLAGAGQGRNLRQESPKTAVSAHGATLLQSAVRLSPSRCAAGKRSMPHASRTGNGTRCLWKPCRDKSHVEYLLDVLLLPGHRGAG